MVEDLEWHEIEIRDDFYRDSFGKVIFVILSTMVAIALLIALAAFLYLNQPPPRTFLTENEWRVVKPVPVERPYLSDPDLLQWVSDAIQKAFVFDFVYYDDQLKNATQYFTTNGWKVFLNQLNIYANYNKVQADKSFITAAPSSAPFVLNRDTVAGRYSWWVQMPLTLRYSSYTGTSTQPLTLQVLVVRVPTLDNLNGVAIDNVLVAKDAG